MNVDFRSQVWLDMQGMDHDIERAVTTGFEEEAMTTETPTPTHSIMMAGIHKIKFVHVYQKGVDGSPMVFEDVESWRIGYNGILVIKGKKWTEVLAPDMWNRVSVNEE